MSKRIVICCDGTWNTPHQNAPTNVVKTARAVLPQAPDGTTQVVFYDWGVGTEKGLDRFIGGAFGEGLVKNVEDAYRFIMHNYEPGDQLFLFGFSRGAFTARSLVGLIRNCGLLHKLHADQLDDAVALYRKPDDPPDSEEAKRFRANYSREIDVHFIGVWDTVGALGIPLRWLHKFTRAKHQFHDVQLSGIVKHAYHALAIDEQRWSFRPSVWEAFDKPGQVVEQAWFAGVHSDIGGGYSATGLSDQSLAWMIEHATTYGLAFDPEYLSVVSKSDPLGTLHNTNQGFYKFMRPHLRPIGLEGRANETISQPALQRHQTPTADYAPTNLTTYLAAHPPASE